MQEQVNKFKKRTQQFGSNSISSEIISEIGTILSYSSEIDGDVNGIDVWPYLRTSQLINFSGSQFSDGLYEYYSIQDSNVGAWVETSSDDFYFYKHDLAVNPFTMYISSDNSIMRKYIVRVKNIKVFGRWPFTDSSVSFTSSIVVTDCIMGGTGNYGTLNGYSNRMTQDNFSVNPGSYTLPNNVWGQAAYSDILADVQYVQKTGNEERALKFDIIYELEFKRIIE